MASFEVFRSEGERRNTCLVVPAGIGLVDSIDRVKSEREVSDIVHVVSTPLATRWLEIGGLSAEIERLTGHQPTATFRTPWDPKPSMMYNRCVVAPLTLNTLTKWASGQADNLAVSMLCEATWTDGVDVTAYLTLNGAYAAHPAASPAIATLKDAGVVIRPFQAGPSMKAVMAQTYGDRQLPPNLRAS